MGVLLGIIIMYVLKQAIPVRRKEKAPTIHLYHVYEKKSTGLSGLGLHNVYKKFIIESTKQIWRGLYRENSKEKRYFI